MDLLEKEGSSTEQIHKKQLHSRPNHHWQKALEGTLPHYSTKVVAQHRDIKFKAELPSFRRKGNGGNMER